MKKFLIERKLVKQIDFSLLIAVILISIFGCANIYSATFRTLGFHTMLNQVLYIFIGLIIIYVLLLFDYNLIGNFSSIFYWVGVILLLYTDVAVSRIKGAKSWISVGSFTIEPGEVIKFALILFLAKKIDSMEGDVNSPKNLIKILFYAAIPIAFIIKQPNLGLALICIFTVFTMLYISKLKLKIIFASILTGIIAIVLILNLHLLQGYQLARLTSFINPKSSQSDNTLQVDNAMLAIGSGGIYGEGFLKGTQVSGGFIPEDQTDMIFSVVGEEWGLIGSGLLILTYAFVLFRIIQISKQSKDIIGKLICVGAFAALSFSVFQNIGMNIRLMPIAGITLPFMSAGGSSMITNMATIGLVLNVGMRKKKINF